MTRPNHPDHEHRREEGPERGPEGENPRHGFEGHGPFGRGFGHHGPEGRNFWREWIDERFHGHDEDFPFRPALSPKEMEAWREFFHQSFGTMPEDHWIFGGRRFSPWHQGMDTFNPFVATLLSKGGGLLPLYVLHLVAEQPRYGNEIMDMLADRTNGQWVSNPGAIYPLLTQLEREEFIQGEWADPTKRSIRRYTITTKGQEELVRIKTIVEPKIEETITVLESLMRDLRGQVQPKADEPGNVSDSSQAQDK
jgi:PadR family transcriptional regulator, regulatory protein PadR